MKQTQATMEVRYLKVEVDIVFLLLLVDSILPNRCPFVMRQMSRIFMGQDIPMVIDEILGG
jgi:hypothetical protein